MCNVSSLTNTPRARGAKPSGGLFARLVDHIELCDDGVTCFPVQMCKSGVPQAYTKQALATAAQAKGGCEWTPILVCPSEVNTHSALPCST